MVSVFPLQFAIDEEQTPAESGRAKRLGMVAGELERHRAKLRLAAAIATAAVTTEHGGVVIPLRSPLDALRAPVAAKLRALLEQAGVSDRDLGAALDITVARVQAMRDGRAAIEAHHVDAMFRRLPATRELLLDAIDDAGRAYAAARGAR